MMLWPAKSQECRVSQETNQTTRDQDLVSDKAKHRENGIVDVLLLTSANRSLGCPKYDDPVHPIQLLAGQNCRLYQLPFRCQLKAFYKSYKSFVVTHAAIRKSMMVRS